MSVIGTQGILRRAWFARGAFRVVAVIAAAVAMATRFPVRAVYATTIARY